MGVEALQATYNRQMDAPRNKRLSKFPFIHRKDSAVAAPASEPPGVRFVLKLWILRDNGPEHLIDHQESIESAETPQASSRVSASSSLDRNFDVPREFLATEVEAPTTEV